ncbi:MAG: hypothetical protein K0V04_24785 [Deltaproteobacteria bacterium]|nr:hypothetical protein [Deltaproteobacteria bacterium]
MSVDAFVTGLMQEHFEEVAGLYESRREQLDEWESNPADLAAAESRIEAHLDGLVLGESKGLEVAVDGSNPDDPSSFYALLALACAADRYDVVQVTLARLDAYCEGDDADPETAAALRTASADALIHHVPPRWADALSHALTDATAHVLPVVVAVIGAGRLARGAPKPLSDAASKSSADPRPILEALARVQGSDVGPLVTHIDDPDPAVAMVAVLGALRRGEVMVVDMLHKRRSVPWSAMALALCSGKSLARILLATKTDELTPQTLLALGLLGDPEALDVLLAALHREPHAKAAALALFLITGALLGDDDAPPQDEDEDTASADEADADEATPPAPVTGAAKANAEAVPPAPVTGAATANADAPADAELDAPPSEPWDVLLGSDISTDPQRWAAWDQEHRSRFRAGFRYRLGALASPRGDLELLAGSSLPLWLRRLLSDEFVIRYGVQSAFEVDMLASRQSRALSEVRAWLDDPRARFTAGAWYFQGRVTQ